MAARLMCNKNAKIGVLCDELTYNRCHEYISLADLGKIKVKGKQHAIGIYRPTCLDEDQEGTKTFQLFKNEIIGRVTDLENVTTDFHNFLEMQKPKALFIDGDMLQATHILQYIAHKQSTKIHHM
jgi:hypothetical protein